MSKFSVLTDYIPKLKDDNFGEWIVDKENDGSPEHPMHFPFVCYSQVVSNLRYDIYSFGEQHPEYNHYHYYDTLDAFNIPWGSETLEGVDLSRLNAKAIIAILVGTCQAEKFSDGTIYEFCKSGAALRCLERLKEIDDGPASFDVVIGFHNPKGAYGCFSNWYQCDFDYAGREYSSVEQYMMYQKVMLAPHQEELAEKIMKLKDPRRIKWLAGPESFKEFDSIREAWIRFGKEIVKRGVRAKFLQHPELMQVLLDTGNALIAECSASDRIWGNGVSIKGEKYKDVSTWTGDNQLGRILMELREEFRQMQKMGLKLGFVDAYDAVPIDEWCMEAGVLMRNPLYFNAIRIYTSHFPAGAKYDRFYYGMGLDEYETNLLSNSIGGIPFAGFFEMKQEIYDITLRNGTNKLKIKGRESRSQQRSRENER